MATTTLHLPKACNEKTNYIKAFYKKLKELSYIPKDDIQCLQAAEYSYQSAQLDAEAAAIHYANNTIS